MKAKVEVKNENGFRKKTKNSLSSSRCSILVIPEYKKRPRKCKERELSYCKVRDTKEDVKLHIGKNVDQLVRVRSKRGSKKSNHVDVDRNKRKCSVCNVVFATAKGLKRHSLVHNGKKTDKCVKCGVHAAERDLKRHICYEKKPYKCCDCGFDFLYITDFKYHRAIHTGERAYKCKECGKSFVHIGTLTHHVRTHTKEKPFKCKECGAEYRQRGSLNRHILCHTLKSLKQYVCEICKAGYTRKTHLNQHVDSVHSRRRHKCEICGKTYSLKRSLRSHVQCHTSDKTWQCNFCVETFFTENELNRHKRRHNGDKPHKCKECDAKFVYKMSLKFHQHIHDRTES